MKKDNFVMNTKKYILLFIGLLLAFAASAQSSTISVCGIPMGTEKKAAEKILEERFGYLNVREDSGNLTVYNGYVGGVYHKYMTFFFAWVNGKSIFNGAIFSTAFELNERGKAIEHRDLIKSVYEKKYRMSDYFNSDGFKSYEFWDKDGYIGFITIIKSESNDGKFRLYAKVQYDGIYDETCDI